MINKDTTLGWQFINDEGNFQLDSPHKTNYLYFPLANEAGMMSSITPNLHGDIKINQNAFLMSPVSSELLHDSRAVRNFWVYIEGKGAWSAAGVSPQQITETFKENSEESVKLEAGFLWQKVSRENRSLGIKSDIINFVPVSEDKVELMKVTFTNITNEHMKVTPTAAVPIYGRSADNIRDHRHVTSLLHKINTNDYGVLVSPTLSFDERGHKPNSVIYSVQGAEGNGEVPIGFFPVVEDFIGEGGSFEWPEVIVKNSGNYCISGENIEGFEAIGAVRFKTVTLAPNEAKTYVLVMGISEDLVETKSYAINFCNEEAFDKALKENISSWKNKLDCLTFNSGDRNFDMWMKWVNLQPMLRRIYGCSFMPHHDYGRGGRGWRDLWQDCLALLVMEPKEVRNLLYNNYAGVRIDGSNATIIGSKPGEFIADRNNIARIWMDHGAWPFLTTKLYIDQSGDLEFLLENQVYFKDKIINRAKAIDCDWNREQGNNLKTKAGELYKGSILEHILVQNLTPFFNVGEHNNIKLEGADWNDGLDMAADKGESVAFTALYGSNLIELSKLLLQLSERKKLDRVEISAGINLLLETIYEKVDYDSVEDKHRILNKYYETCKHTISGENINVDIKLISKDLKEKGQWIINHIRKNEWISDSEGNNWFNGYYDNEGERLEGEHKLGTRMTLTGQVFTIMGGIADNKQVQEVAKTAKKYLRDEKVGGYRLNTNFHEVKLNMGRCFGFAYGSKENGAMFSHMSIMYANALYKRGYVNEGHEVLDLIYKHCSDFKASRIYPGIPEYINEKGRGMYHYLTGSASWLILTILTEVYGIKGYLGDLMLEPKLVKNQFNSIGEAKVFTLFAERRLSIIYSNKNDLDYDEYKVKAVKVNGKEVELEYLDNAVVMGRKVLEALEKEVEHTIYVELG